jgi:hypothetical protein
LNRQYFLNGLKEGSWEIRAKVFCSGYDAFATSEVRGSVTDENLNLIADTKAPRPIAGEVYKNMVLVEFSEPITCPLLSSSDMAYSVTRTTDCDGNAVDDSEDINAVSDNILVSHYDFECLTQDVNGRNAWMMTVPISSAASSNALAGKYTVTIKSGHVTDDGGNTASEHTFTEEIMCTSSSASASLGGKASNESSANLGLSKENSSTREALASATYMPLSSHKNRYIFGGTLVGAAFVLFAQTLFAFFARGKRRTSLSGMSDKTSQNNTTNNNNNNNSSSGDEGEIEILLPLAAEKFGSSKQSLAEVSYGSRGEQHQLRRNDCGDVHIL